MEAKLSGLLWFQRQESNPRNLETLLDSQLEQVPLQATLIKTVFRLWNPTTNAKSLLHCLLNIQLTINFGSKFLK